VTAVADDGPRESGRDRHLIREALNKLADVDIAVLEELIRRSVGEITRRYSSCG